MDYKKALEIIENQSNALVSAQMVDLYNKFQHKKEKEKVKKLENDNGKLKEAIKDMLCCDNKCIGCDCGVKDIVKE